MVESNSTLWPITIMIVASTGIAIVSAEIFGAIVPLDPVISAIALTALATPLTYVCYKMSLSMPGQASTRNIDTEQMDAEEVKQQTERWSEEAMNNPAFPPGQEPDHQVSSAGQNGPRSSVDNSASNRTQNQLQKGDQSDSNVHVPETEFDWKTETGVSFADIGGMRDLKDKLRTEVLKPLENPKKADELGVAAPNLILHGPPGTGKTYTAKALATELGLPFASLSGADVTSKWINESASMVNDLFTEAKELAAREGGAVVFLDELDSVLKERSGSGSSHEEDNKVVNEFLRHLQETKEHNIVFVGATNRLEALDDAGIRSGRIDLKIKIGKPGIEAREAILRAQLSERKHALANETLAELAAATDGAVAADLEQLVQQAAKNVLSRGGDTIHRSDFD